MPRDNLALSLQFPGLFTVTEPLISQSALQTALLTEPLCPGTCVTLTKGVWFCLQSQRHQVSGSQGELESQNEASEEALLALAFICHALPLRLSETEDKHQRACNHPGDREQVPGALGLGGDRNTDRAAPTGTQGAATPALPRKLGSGSP